MRDLLMVPMQRVLKYHLLLQVHKSGGLLGSVTMALAYLPPCVTGVGVELASGGLIGAMPWLAGTAGGGRRSWWVRIVWKDPQEEKTGLGDVCLRGSCRSW